MRWRVGSSWRRHRRDGALTSPPVPAEEAGALVWRLRRGSRTQQFPEAVFHPDVAFGEACVDLDIANAFLGQGHTRIVNGDDPVAPVPPEFVLGHERRGDIVSIGAPGSVVSVLNSATASKVGRKRCTS